MFFTTCGQTVVFVESLLLPAAASQSWRREKYPRSQMPSVIPHTRNLAKKSLDEKQPRAMFTNNLSSIRFKGLHVNTSAGRFWSDPVRLERNIVQKGVVYVDRCSKQRLCARSCLGSPPLRDVSPPLRQPIVFEQAENGFWIHGECSNYKKSYINRRCARENIRQHDICHTFFFCCHFSENWTTPHMAKRLIAIERLVHVHTHTHTTIRSFYFI